MKKFTDKQKRTLHLILTIIIMVFIFVQSAMPDYASAEESNFFVEIAESIIESVSSAEIDFEMLSTVIRKLAHFTEYTVFGACLLLTVRDHFHRKQGTQSDLTQQSNSAKSGTGQQSTKQQITPTQKLTSKTIYTIGAFAWLLGTIYAITDEIHQYFVPNRCCSLWDILIDSSGALFGVFLCHLVYTKWKRRN